MADPISPATLRGGQRYVFNPQSIICSKRRAEEQVGARLIAFADRWTVVTDDKWILDSLSHGVKLDFSISPTHRTIPVSVVMPKEMEAVCDREVRDLVRKRAIREITDGSEGFVCSLFVIPKKSGGFRPIINLKPLNQFIRYEHFKMENLESARFLLPKGDWMVKLDLKDAYLTVPVCAAHQKFLRFQWKGRLFQFACLAFGLASAPRIFTKILKVVMGFLRKKGVRLIIYLDDILILNVSEESTLGDLNVTIQLLKHLGFLINWEKSVLVPTQVLEYLGLVIDSVRLSFALPNIKVKAVKKMCEAALAAESISLRKIASIMGNVTWAIPAIPYAQAHYRRLQWFYIKQAQSANFNLKTRCSLSAEAREDLECWVFNLNKTQDKIFFPHTPDLEIYTDASLSGWGACCDEIRTRGSWTPADIKKHINELELLGAFFAVQAFAAQSKNISIRVFLDNSTAVAYINHCGGSRSQALTNVSAQLTTWCENRGISLEAVHVAGKLNIIADEESRAGPDAGDWKLDPRVFKCIQELWPSVVDAFATPWNAQLPSFISWHPQPGAMATNAFSVNWKGLLAYCFPPFALIFKCLGKIRREKSVVVFFCPVWIGQPWFPLLLELSCDVPRLLAPSQTLLKSALDETHPLTWNNALHLAVWKLSGDSNLSEDFRQRWSTYSWPELGPTPKPLMSQHGEIGCIDVWGGVRIPSQLL
ncbi:uncharacterized protein LOC130685703 [Daphnia carinata]|uniref:uncharacterized protein LOC130685703 n=1 Tax=Daphnia carinata TaxID=120202 RepID=UPI00257F7283|nr:uncharacterized protein LOC130685703 [Daphnia carinata]